MTWHRTSRSPSFRGVLAGVATSAGALVPLTEGAPIQLCDSTLTSLTIVAGRGPLNAPSDATAQFARIESCTPPTPPARTGVLPGCVLGTWDLSFPFMQQRAQPAGGTYQMTFNPDGTYSLRAQNYTLTLPGSSGRAS